MIMHVGKMPYRVRCLVYSLSETDDRVVPQDFFELALMPKIGSVILS